MDETPRPPLESGGTGSQGSHFSGSSGHADTVRLPDGQLAVEWKPHGRQWWRRFGELVNTWSGPAFGTVIALMLVSSRFTNYTLTILTNALGEWWWETPLVVLFVLWQWRVARRDSREEQAETDE